MQTFILESKKFFIKEGLTKTHNAFKFKKGDLVSWTNDYGVEWQHRALGFGYTTDSEYKPEPCLYLETECYWFPYTVSRMIKSKFKLIY